MTEREKMLAGEMYSADCEELSTMRLRCKTLCERYNSLPVAELDKRHALLAEILGHTEGVAHIEPSFWCDYGVNISVGRNFYANHNLTILDCARVTFGDNVFIGPDCGFYTAEHPLDVPTRNAGKEYARPITVGDDVWIGGGVRVVSGVSIGEGSVIGAGSVVVHDIPPHSVAVGNPCRVIRKLE